MIHEIRTINISVIHKQPGETPDFQITDALDIKRERIIQLWNLIFKKKKRKGFTEGGVKP